MTDKPFAFLHDIAAGRYEVTYRDGCTKAVTKEEFWALWRPVTTT